MGYIDFRIFMVSWILSCSALGEAPCDRFDKFVKQGVPEVPLKQLLVFFDHNRKSFASNPRFLSLADYSQNSRLPRFYLLDLKQGAVSSFKVSHGSGKVGTKRLGDPEHDGMLNRCRVPENMAKKHQIHRRKNMTRPGFFKTGPLYTSASHREVRKKGRLTSGWPNISGKKNAMRLTGLSIGVNEGARRNGVVMHGAWYNAGEIMGRSFGCPAFVPKKAKEVLNKIKDGSLFYAYAPVCSEDMAHVLKEIPWKDYCSKE